MEKVTQLQQSLITLIILQVETGGLLLNLKFVLIYVELQSPGENMKRPEMKYKSSDNWGTGIEVVNVRRYFCNVQVELYDLISTLCIHREGTMWNASCLNGNKDPTKQKSDRETEYLDKLRRQILKLKFRNAR